MACIFHARLNQLWSIWYTLCMVLLQSYLIYLGFERYRLYSDMKWPHGSYPSLWLKIYFILYSLCIPLLLIFTSLGVFKTGNIAGDNDKLGARSDRVFDTSRRSALQGKGGCIRCIKSMWQHSPPMPQQIHVFIALLQLFSQQIMLAQLYRYGFINSGDFLNTELDFLYQRARQLANNLPMLDNRLQGFRISAHDLSGAPIGPNLLPILMHARLFGIPLEFVNFLIALFAYTCSYSSVFWRVSKPFSIMFSFHLIVHATTVIWSYLGFSILYRIQETNYASVRPIGLGQYLSSSRPLKIYHPLAIMSMYLVAVLLIHIAPIAFYTYGYNKFFAGLLAVRYKANNVRNQANSMTGHSDYSEYCRRNSSKVPVANLCCDGYAPHITAILLLVLIVIVKAPIIYALMVLYQHEEKPLLLTCIVVDITYLFTWIIFWLLLTLKREWDFKVIHQPHEIIALQSGYQTMTGILPFTMDKNLSDLKNALILMHGDQMYMTDDAVTKQNIMRFAQKGAAGPGDDVYWLRANGGQSPATRKIPLTENVKETPEMNRLLGGSLVQRRGSDDTSVATATYQTMVRPAASSVAHGQPIYDMGKYNRESNTVDSSGIGNNIFGTLQRNQRSDYIPTINRQPAGEQRKSSGQGSTNACQGSLNSASATSDTTRSQAETYASIHKGNIRAPQLEGTQRKISPSKDEAVLNPAYSNMDSSYGTYSTYTRLPPQTHTFQDQPIFQQNTVHSRPVGSQGTQQASITHRYSSDTGIPPSMGSIRASPVIGDTRLRSSNASREPSPYQRSTNLKLSSFTSGTSSNREQQKPQMIQSVANAPSWSQQRQQPQQSTVQWINNPTYNKAQGNSSADGNQQSQCFSPTSTLTSQGSVSNYSSQHTPTPGSPNLLPTSIFNNQVDSHFGGVDNNDLYTNIDDRHLKEGRGIDLNEHDRTLKATTQKPIRTAIATGNTTIRHQIRVVKNTRQDDSANYSLTSSNESADNTRSVSGAESAERAEYATSIV